MFKKALVLVCLIANSAVVCQANHLSADDQKVTAKSIESLRRQIDKLESSHSASTSQITSLMDNLCASYKSLNQPEKARFWELKSNELKGIVEPQDIISRASAGSRAEVLGAGFESHASDRIKVRLKNLIPAAGM